jgi:hypothetical protein
MAYMNNKELLSIVVAGNVRDSEVAYATLLDRGLTEEQVIGMLTSGKNDMYFHSVIK